jgi:hypothetical protein
MKRDSRVTAYIRGRAPFARSILTHLRTVIHDADPALEESIRWGMPTFLYRGKIVCGLGAFKAHCALWFRDGDEIVGEKPGAGMGQFGRIKSLDDVPAATDIARYVRKATARIDEQTTRRSA